eukprot:2180216-Pyramimonas_sp.AAC.1
MLAHAQQVEQLPTEVNTTEAVFLDKWKGQQKRRRVRVIHLLDALWKFWRPVVYTRGEEAKENDAGSPGWWH